MRDDRSPRRPRPSILARVLALAVALVALRAGAAAAQTNPPLHEAAKMGDVAEVRRLLDAGAAVDERGAGDHTALMAASSYGEVAVVKLLLSRGADISLRDDRGRTALDRARQNSKTEVVRLLELMAEAAAASREPADARADDAPPQKAGMSEVLRRKAKPARPGRKGSRERPGGEPPAPRPATPEPSAAGRRPDPVGPTPATYPCYDVPAGTPMPWEMEFTGIAELPPGRAADGAMRITGPGTYQYGSEVGRFGYDARTTMVRWLSGPLATPGVQAAFARTRAGGGVLYLRTPSLRVACALPEG